MGRKGIKKTLKNHTFCNTSSRPLLAIESSADLTVTESPSGFSIQSEVLMREPLVHFIFAKMILCLIDLI